MEKAVLLAEIRATLASAPDFSSYSLTSVEHRRWLARVDALIGRWNSLERSVTRPAESMLVSRTARDLYVNRILSTLERAESDLALELGSGPAHVFGSGAVYDVFNALREVMESAQSSLFIVDPYLDPTTFDKYLTTVAKNTEVRLLARRYAGPLAQAVSAFNKQHQTAVEVRISDAIHDRVIFVDDRTCWVVGQSLKDAARTAPTYIAPLDAVAATDKLAAYKATWSTARALAT